MGDIHGCFEEWLSLKNRIEKLDKEARFILVGDIIDRGPEIYKMLCWAREHITDSGAYQMVIGNHEYMKLPWMRTYLEQAEEAGKSGKIFQPADMPPDRYDFRGLCCRENLGYREIKQLYEWFMSLPYYKEVEISMRRGRQRFIIVHGDIVPSCINKDGSFRKRSVGRYAKDAKKREWAEQVKQRIVWERNYAGNTVARNTIVVHGHTPTIDTSCTDRGAVSGKIWYLPQNINVDCGAVYDGVTYKGDLAALRLEDFREFYVRDYTLTEKRDFEAFERNMERKSQMLHGWAKQ